MQAVKKAKYYTKLKFEGPLDDDYVCSSCTQLNQTIPYGNDHSIAESILQEQVDTVQPNCYNSGYNHLQVTATAIVQKQNMVNGTNNLYPKNAIDIVHEETNPKVPTVKRKTKQSNKSKDIPDRERQLDEQLIQCKARIAMLEDLNRYYKIPLTY
jgi:hypothetical protein